MKKFLEKGSRLRSNSLGEIDEIVKRKREENEEAESSDSKIFKTSLKTNRTPIKSSSNSKMEEVLIRLTDIMKELKEIKESNRILQLSNNQIREEFKLYREEVDKETAKLKARVTDLERTIGEIEEKAEKKEKLERKNNIIFTGYIDKEINTDTEKVKSYLENLCKEITNSEAIELQEVFHITTNKKGMDIVRAKINGFDNKIKIMKNKYKLASKNKIMFIDDDFTRKEAEIQKKLRFLAITERKKNNKVKVGYRKMCVNDTWIKWEDLNKENQQLKRKEEKDVIKKKIVEDFKIGFWNINGLENKDNEFWNYIESFDFVGRK